MQVSNLTFGKGSLETNFLRINKKALPQTAFGAESKCEQKNEKKEGSNEKLSFKTISNALGVVAWLFIVGYSIKDLKMLQKEHPESIIRGLKDAKKGAKNYIENKVGEKTQTIDAALEGQKNKGLVKFFYNLGDKFQKAKMKLGGELFNNLLYAFGTLVVMPAVVILSPSKKETSKEDKFFTVLRQPLSVGATLGMQFTFDKLIDKYVPEVLKKNDDYNIDTAKSNFKKSTEKLLTGDEINSIFDLKTFEEESADTYKGKIKDILNEKFKLNLGSLDEIDKKAEIFENFKKIKPTEAKKMEEISAGLKAMANVINNNKMAVQKSKTIVNVVAASIIGCTFLNVIYGKTMKGIKNLNKQKQVEKNEAKEVK